MFCRQDAANFIASNARLATLASDRDGCLGGPAFAHPNAVRRFLRSTRACAQRPRPHSSSSQGPAREKRALRARARKRPTKRRRESRRVPGRAAVARCGSGCGTPAARPPASAGRDPRLPGRIGGTAAHCITPSIGARTVDQALEGGGPLGVGPTPASTRQEAHKKGPEGSRRVRKVPEAGPEPSDLDAPHGRPAPLAGGAVPRAGPDVPHGA